MENAFANQKIESRSFHYLQVKLSPRSLSSLSRQRQTTHPQLRGRTMKTYFKTYCFKPTFLKYVTEECTFCWKVFLATLKKYLVWFFVTICYYNNLYLYLHSNFHLHSIACTLPAWIESYACNSVLFLDFFDSHVFLTAEKIRFSGARKSVLLKASSGERCAPRNFVHLVTLTNTRVRLIVYLAVHQMKYVMERWSNAIIFCNFLT